jgi:hypothetical protein
MTMLERIDDVSNRLLTFFLSPVVNSTILLIIYSWCVKGDKSLYSLLHESWFNLSLVVKDLYSVVSKDHKDLLESLGPNALTNPAATAALVAQSATIASGIISYLIFLLSIGLVLTVFLIDRLLFAIGWLVPPDVDFDYAFYGKINNERTRSLNLNVSPGIDFFDSYGIIRSYLGEQSTDKFRDNFRDGIIKGISRAESYICYVKSYILLTACVLLSAILGKVGIINVSFLILPSLFVFCASLAVFFSFCMLYSSKYQQLVEYDVNSFCWLRAFSCEKMKFEVKNRFVEVDKNKDDQSESSDGLAISVNWLLLRFKISGFLNELFGAIWRRIPRVKGHGKSDTGSIERPGLPKSIPESPMG